MAQPATIAYNGTESRDHIAYRFRIGSPEAIARFKNEACCDAAHIGGNRYRCEHRKSLLLYGDARFSLIHTGPTITPGFTIQAPSMYTMALSKTKKVQEAEAAERIRLENTKASKATVNVGSAVGALAAAEKIKPAHTISTTSPPIHAATSADDRSKVVKSLEEHKSVSTHTSSPSSNVTIAPGITPTSTTTTAKSAVSVIKASAMPGSFDFETQVKKADLLSLALQEAKASCDAAKKTEEEKARKRAQRKTGIQEPDEDWELIEGAAVDGEDYDYVDVGDLL